MNKFSNHVFHFDQIQVDPKASSINVKGRVKRLEPKVIMLLSYFAAHSQQVISRQQLTDALWPDIIVGDETITRAIFSLRNALGDDAQNPRFIETIPKKGYRFLVSPTFCKVASKPFNKIHSGLALIAIGVFVVFLNFQLDLPELKIAKIQPFTNMTGAEYDFSLNQADSESNRKIAFINKTATNTRLVVKAIKSGELQILEDSEWLIKSPKWIDESTLVYIRCNPDGCQIARKILHGKTETIYSSIKSVTHLEVVNSELPLILFAEQQNNTSAELKSINLINGQIESLKTKFDSLPNMADLPIYSKQTNILYVIGINAQKKTIYSFDFDSGDLINTNNLFGNIRSLAMGLNSNQLIISGVKDTTSGIWTYDIEEDKADLILPQSGAEIISSAQIDRLNKIIYFSNYLIDYDINQISFTGESEALAKINSDASEIYGKYTKNGEQLFFISNRSGHLELWQHDYTTAINKQISHLNSLAMWSPQISNNGRYAAVVYKQQTLNLGVIELSSGSLLKSIPLSSMKFPLAWSQDDETIYVSEHNRYINLLSYKRKTLERINIKKRAGLFAEESSDGKSLVTFDYKQNAFVSIDLTSDLSISTPTAITDKITNSEYLSPGQVLLKNHSIVIAKNQENETQVIEYPLLNDITEKKPRVISTNLEQYPVSHISPNGEKLLIYKPRPDRGNIMAMQLE